MDKHYVTVTADAKILFNVPFQELAQYAFSTASHIRFSYERETDILKIEFIEPTDVLKGDLKITNGYYKAKSVSIRKLFNKLEKNVKRSKGRYEVFPQSFSKFCLCWAINLKCKLEKEK